MGHELELTGPDLRQGMALADLPDGAMVEGHADGEPVLVARRGERVFAIGARCTHYGAPLVDGLLVGDTVRCPWHHACFSLTSGEAVRAPALSAVPCWKVERRAERIVVTGKAAPDPPRTLGGKHPEKIVIVGAGGAGNAAALMLRREGFSGAITMIGAEPSVPYDRPSLSKEYLAGSASAEGLPLHAAPFYEEHGIALVLGARVTALEIEARRVRLDDGAAHPYDALLLATGADPVKLPIPGGDLPHVYTLRTRADSAAIIAKAGHARRAVVIGASFIGLEAAASLRAREIDVHVVEPARVPLERVLGSEVGAFVRRLHEQHGVVFHLGQTARQIGPEMVALADGTQLPADLVVVGVGVRPSVALAEAAGLPVDNGVLVDQYLETGTPGIFAAGDIARVVDPRTGERVRIEHWVVAERQGQAAARNMLGMREPFDAVPFFWSAHYDLTLAYVGHAARWDRIAIHGSLEQRDCRIEYVVDETIVAVATVGRDRESLAAEVEMETHHSKGRD
jgi:3-phenylpropionate/trans-cinnamate dioxygenase ferredoxin reductase subunit